MAEGNKCVKIYNHIKKFRKNDLVKKHFHYIVNELFYSEHFEFNVHFIFRFSPPAEERPAEGSAEPGPRP